MTRPKETWHTGTCSSLGGKKKQAWREEGGIFAHVTNRRAVGTYSSFFPPLPFDRNYHHHQKELAAIATNLFFFFFFLLCAAPAQCDAAPDLRTLSWERLATASRRRRRGGGGRPSSLANISTRASVPSSRRTALFVAPLNSALFLRLSAAADGKRRQKEGGRGHD